MQFAIISDPSSVLRRLVESSDPDDLQARVQVALDELATLGGILAAVNLSGAGDGHKWVVELVAAFSSDLTSLEGTTPLPTGIESSLDPAVLAAVCYKAADVRELAVQRDRAIAQAAPLGVQSITLETLTGAAQGLQHMGLLLLQPASPQ